MAIRLKGRGWDRQPVDRKPKTGNARHTVRIIGGQWKRTPVAVVDAEGLRPTPERVRETLFNWLGHFWDGSFVALTCLDMFAGTGALGFEAASRGFRHVTMIEKNRAVLRQLQAVRSKLQAEQVDILSGDALVLTKAMVLSGKQFDLICLDPPFHDRLLPEILPVCLKLLAEDGRIYVESDNEVTEQFLDECGMKGMRVVRAGRAGQVYYHLLEKTVS